MHLSRDILTAPQEEQLRHCLLAGYSQGPEWAGWRCLSKHSLKTSYLSHLLIGRVSLQALKFQTSAAILEGPWKRLAGWPWKKSREDIHHLLPTTPLAARACIGTHSCRKAGQSGSHFLSFCWSCQEEGDFFHIGLLYLSSLHIL